MSPGEKNFDKLLIFRYISIFFILYLDITWDWTDRESGEWPSTYVHGLNRTLGAYVACALIIQLFFFYDFLLFIYYSTVRYLW